MEHKQKITSHSGFTLIEAIVTMIIILFFMGIILTGTIEARQRFFVRDSAQQFADVIRQAINDTKNGIKVKVIDCTPHASAPRQCSNYKIKSVGALHTGYEKYVETTDKEATESNIVITKYIESSGLLQGGTAFVGELTLDFVFSSGSFPLVKTTSAGSAGATSNGTGTIQMTIKSLSNENIKTNICILKSGTVLVQADDCS